MTRHSRRRRYGIGLLLFGLSGIGLVIAAALLVLGSLAAVNDAATGFERQRAEILAMLGPASDALDGAATSATNASTSLSETAAAAGRAADLTTRLATSFDGLATLSQFEILGSRPFGSLGTQFADVATQSRALSTDLADAAASMATNVDDAAAVAEDLRALSVQLATLEASLRGTGGAGGATLPVDGARLVLLGLLAWFAIPAMASIWLGVKLVRRSRRERS